MIVSRVAPGSVVHADEANHWAALHARFLTKRINHSESFSDGQACTNQAESFFSRLRRAKSAFITMSRVRTCQLMPAKWLGVKITAA